MVGRPYDMERDIGPVTRMWREVGWIDDTDGQAAGLRDFLEEGHSIVADIEGEPECLVQWAPGSLRHDGHDLSLCAITAVTTSHVARRQGLASTLTVEALDAGRRSGAAVAGLGIFDQGFYDRFGFGTGAYHHRFDVDPASLSVPVPERPPVRLQREDWAEMHALLMRRHRGHGSAVIDPPTMFSAELAWTSHPFALGFRADDGRLTHFVLGSIKDEYGPYDVDWLAYEEPAQLLELLGVLRALGDQVASMSIPEPPEIQLQDLVRTPFRQRRMARLAGGSGALQQARATMQFRILDLEACIGAIRLPAGSVEFTLRLTDPLARTASGAGAGIGGDHTVRLAERSTVQPGATEGLPVLHASVNAFTRLWLGVRPATSLALTDDLAGDPQLLRSLDDRLRLPEPHTGWSF